MKIGRTSLGHLIFPGCSEHAGYVTDPQSPSAEIVIRSIGANSTIIIHDSGAERLGHVVGRNGKWQRK